VKVLIVDKATQQPVSVAKVAITCGETRTGGTLPVEVEVSPGTCRVGATAAGYQRGEIELAVADGPPVEARLELEPVRDAQVTITRERIELRDSIRFETGKAVLKPPFGGLDEAAQILLDYPEIKKLRIEGHTDERGPDDFNLKLSRDRAKAVLDYFVSKGVDPSRLSSEGFGETRPVDAAHTEAAWAKNRRTDFFIDVWEAVPMEETAPRAQ
jgi:outer membrane protein OmpA-like peptidoglycan-associated protein